MTTETGAPPAAGVGVAAAGLAAREPAQQPAQQPAAQVPEWAAQYPDELKGVVAAKGWKDPADALKSYVSLERSYGADRAGRAVILPAKEDDAEGWNGVYAKLGRPEKPEGYGLEKIGGLDPEFVKAISPELHALGLSAKQAQGAASAYSRLALAAVEKAEGEFAARAAREMAELRQEWGQKFEERQALAQRAVRAFLGAAKLAADGTPDPSDPVMQALGQLERAWGTQRLYRFWDNIAARLGD